MSNETRRDRTTGGSMAIYALTMTLWLMCVDDARAQSVVLEIGTTVEAIGSLDAWESYPSGFSLNSGELITEIQPGEVYEVIGSKIVPSFLWGDSYYIRLRLRDDSEHPCRILSCWVFHGRDRTGPPWNLRVLTSEASSPAEGNPN